MTAGEILTSYLEAHGLDGLVNEDLECACVLDDLVSCARDRDGGAQPDCRPGVKMPCPDACGEHEWHVVATEEA